MNVIQGFGHSTSGRTSEDQQLRSAALHYAVEWARSAGPEHSTRVPPEDFVAAAQRYYDFLKGQANE